MYLRSNIQSTEPNLVFEPEITNGTSVIFTNSKKLEVN